MKLERLSKEEIEHIWRSSREDRIGTTKQIAQAQLNADQSKLPEIKRETYQEVIEEVEQSGILTKWPNEKKWESIKERLLGGEGCRLIPG